MLSPYLPLWRTEYPKSFELLENYHLHQLLGIYKNGNKSVIKTTLQMMDQQVKYLQNFYVS